MSASIPMRLTDEQREVVESSESSLAITAYAGTGKTSTLKAIAAARPRERILYLAFNKALAEDSKASFQDQRNVEVRTIHSLAWSVVGKKFSNISNPRSLDIIPYLGDMEKNVFRYELARLVLDAFNAWLVSNCQTLKGFFRDYSRSVAIRLQDLRHFDIGPKLKPSAIEAMVKKIWDDCQSGRFAMPHNGYLKLFQLKETSFLDRFDRILVDEAQDLNDCMIDVIKSNQAKKVLVGDPYQQIYGFNGAVNALGKAEADGVASRFLTQSFRCPVPVADLANKYLKLLNAPKDFKGVDAPLPRKENAGALFIARTNAGLFDFVAKAMETGRRSFNFNGGFDSYEFETILDVVRLKNGDHDNVQNKFMKRFKNFSDLKNYAELAGDTALNTRLNIGLKYLDKAFKILPAMRRSQAPEKTADFVTTTAHKIKGREYETVTMLDDFLPIIDPITQGRRIKKESADYGKKSLQMTGASREEFRLIYVSVTRSFKHLVVPKKYMITDQQIRELNSLVEEGFVKFYD